MLESFAEHPIWRPLLARLIHLLPTQHPLNPLHHILPPRIQPMQIRQRLLKILGILRIDQLPPLINLLPHIQHLGASRRQHRTNNDRIIRYMHNPIDTLYRLVVDQFLQFEAIDVVDEGWEGLRESQIGLFELFVLEDFVPEGLVPDVPVVPVGVYEDYGF